MREYRIWHDDCRFPPVCATCNGNGQPEGDGSGWDGAAMHTPACEECGGSGSIWQWARTNKEFVHMILQGESQGMVCVECSLDHDLGLEDVADQFAGPYTEGWKPNANQRYLLKGASQNGDGVDLVKALIALRIVPPKVTIHSWNEAGAEYMAGMLRSLSGAEVTVAPFQIVDGMCALCGRVQEVCDGCRRPA